MRNRMIWMAAALAGMVLAGDAHADAITEVTFAAGSQSFWGPGKSSASLDKGGRASVEIFGRDVGVGFNVNASSGTISGRYGGDLTLLGASSHDLASGNFALDSSFGAASNTLNTSFGASLDVFGFLEGLQLSFPGFEKGYSLSSSGTVNRGLGLTRNFSGSTNLDLNALDIGIASIGATLRITQASSFEATSITGRLVARHVGSGTTIQRSYRVGDAVGLDLGLAGDWLLSLRDLTLNNSFRTGFDGAVGGFGELLGSRKEITTKNFDLFDTSSFGLNFNELDWNGAMRVSVFDSTPISTDPVPEPGTWVLMGGVGAFLALRRRRRRR